MLFWAMIGCILIPLMLTISQIRNTKRDRARKMKLIERRLAEKESKDTDTAKDKDNLC